MRESDAFLEKEERERVAWARSKHPDWGGKGLHWALGVLEDEVEELRYAIEHESIERVFDEATDVAAVAHRIRRGEWQ